MTFIFILFCTSFPRVSNEVSTQLSSTLVTNVCTFATTGEFVPPTRPNVPPELRRFRTHHVYEGVYDDSVGFARQRGSMD